MLSETGLQQPRMLKHVTTKLRGGVILLVISMLLGWFRIDQTGCLKIALGGLWGNMKASSSGLQASAITRSIVSLHASLIEKANAVLSLGMMIFGLFALYGVWKTKLRTLKCSSFLLLLLLAANLALALRSGANVSHYLMWTPGTLFVNFGDILMALAAITLLLESSVAFKTSFSTTRPPSSPLRITVPRTLRVVQCHICPLKEVCKEGNPEASYNLAHSNTANLEEDSYATMLKVTLNCPLKKNIEST